MIEYTNEAIERIRRCLDNVQVTGIEQAKNLVLITALLNTGRESNGIRDCRLDEAERTGFKLRKQKKAGRAVRNSRVHRNGSSEQSAPGKPSGEDAGATECTAEYTENRDVSENKDGVHPLKDCHRLPE